MKLQVLVVFEDEFRSYREAVAYAIQTLHPHVEVAVAGVDELEVEAARTSPELVICSQPPSMGLCDALVWLEVPTDPGRTARLCLEGCCSELAHPTLDRLVSIVESTETLARLRVHG